MTISVFRRTFIILLSGIVLLLCLQDVAAQNDDHDNSNHNIQTTTSSNSNNNANATIERKRKQQSDIQQENAVVNNEVNMNLDNNNANIERNNHDNGISTTGFEVWIKELETTQSEMERILWMGGGYYFGSIPPYPPPATNPPFAPSVRIPQSQPAVIPIPPSPTTTNPPMTTGGPQGVPSLSPTTSSSCLTGNQTVETFLLETLSSITNETLLLNPMTPQGLAFNYTVHDPFVISHLCTYPTIEQRYALAVIYYATTGDNWYLSEGWLQPIEECSWLGVSCDDNIYATSIDLSNNNLVGTLPDEISALYTLTQLELYNNKVQSTIPQSIVNLTSINVLDLENNQFTGIPLSSSILQLTTLQQIFLSSNNFTGTIPANITQLSYLSALWLASNRMNGTIPNNIGNLSNISTLIIYENNFAGSIPNSLGALTDMTNLQIYGNIFEGTVPDFFYDFRQLTVLRMDSNFLVGTLSSNIGQLSQLTDLRFDNNFIGGSIPTELMKLTDLRYLIAGTNLLNGTIPNEFTDFQNLQDIDFSNNLITGTIPDTIFDAVNLTLAYFSTNQLTGTIPSSYSKPPGLMDLYLDSNLLTGTVPDIQDGALSQLTELLLQINGITGTMPTSICSLRTNDALANLFSDCGGSNPQIQCDFPNCCNRCFEGTTNGTTRRRQLLTDHNNLEKLGTKARQRTRQLIMQSPSSQRHQSQRNSIDIIQL